jgi:hypothetical protein
VNYPYPGSKTPIPRRPFEKQQPAAASSAAGRLECEQEKQLSAVSEIPPEILRWLSV